jgi:hypothetical protein
LGVRLKETKILGDFGHFVDSRTIHGPIHGGFRVNAKIRRKLARGKRRIAKRLDKRNTTIADGPVLIHDWRTECWRTECARRSIKSLGRYARTVIFHKMRTCRRIPSMHVPNP